MNCTFYMHIISSYDYDDISTNKRQQKESKRRKKDHDDDDFHVEEQDPYGRYDTPRTP